MDTKKTVKKGRGKAPDVGRIALVSFRVAPHVLERIGAAAAYDGEDRSTWIRQAVLERLERHAARYAAQE